jgi:hypothetical protein
VKGGKKGDLPAADIVRFGFADLRFAHRAFCVRLILRRPAADMVRDAPFRAAAQRRECFLYALELCATALRGCDVCHSIMDWSVRWYASRIRQCSNGLDTRTESTMRYLKPSWNQQVRQKVNEIFPCLCESERNQRQWLSTLVRNYGDVCG